MIFSLDVRRARKGDCLLLHFGSSDDPGLAIIDGGPSDVYVPHLRPRLERIKRQRRETGTLGGDRDPLLVDLLMVSHVDDDHIKGILDLTREIRQAQHQAPLIQVLNLWHNSFEDLLGQESGSAIAQFGTAALGGNLPEDALDDIEDDEKRENLAFAHQVLASIGQGQTLRRDATALEWPLNPEFDGKLAAAGERVLKVAEQGLTFRVIGPMQPEIDGLRKEHAKWLEEQKRTGRKGGAALAAYDDDSVANLSSIVVLASFAGKSMLLTGDARGDRILAGLELSRVLQAGGRLHVDILKVPHHGSARNVERAFFERITADHYVFSGNGEHGNPERATMKMLFEARSDRNFFVHLTYPLDIIDTARQEDWKKEQRNEKRRAEKRKAEGKPFKPPRENWSRDKHGLVAFFETLNFPKERLLIVDHLKPHVIDVLEPLGY
jgi:hypothetical protein